jgi:hypothetical protein
MTITRRPPRPAASAAPVRRKKTAESFIEDAHHPAVPEPAKTTAPEPLPLPAAAPAEEEKHSKKGKEKGKTKDKSKGKEKHKKRKDKEAVLIRFEDEQLTLMDERAAALGLSRAAWLRMVVSKALRGKKA